MTRGLFGTILVAVLGVGVACAMPQRRDAVSGDSAVLAAREARFHQALAHPDTGASNAPIARWHLPQYLQEISGLALTRDGRLLAHGDQRGKVYQIDYRRGTVVKEFSVGSPAARGDFEAIAVVGDTVYLMTSDAVLYQFPEGANGHAAQYTMIDTGLGNVCEFESLAFDPAIKSLLLACKRPLDKSLKDSLVIFRWKLDDPKGNKKPSHLAVPLTRIIGSNDWEGLRPSDLTIDPFNGNYVLIASQQQALIEITPTGSVVFAQPLPRGHEQAEGVAITRDSVLMISDEAKGGPALLTLYRWPLGAK